VQLLLLDREPHLIRERPHVYLVQAQLKPGVSVDVAWVAQELEKLVLSFAMIREGEITIPKSSVGN